MDPCDRHRIERHLLVRRRREQRAREPPGGPGDSQIVHPFEEGFQ